MRLHKVIIHSTTMSNFASIEVQIGKQAFCMFYIEIVGYK
jgi:hypothetical protein